MYNAKLSQESNQRANEIRSQLLPKITEIINGPHSPELTLDEKAKVLIRIQTYLEKDTRVQFWHQLGCQLTPKTKDGIVILTKTMLKWAGRIKPKTNDVVPTQKIKHAKNGRVIRDPKGL